MPLNALDAYVGLDAAALKLQSRRMELLAKNLANADTPGYKAQDIDFRAALAAAGAAPASPAGASTAGVAGGALQLATTDAQHLGGASGANGANGAPDPQLKYRVPLAPSLDGNTVDEQLEQAAFAENTVRYQASLSFLTTKLRDLMTAITGS